MEPEKIIAKAIIKDTSSWRGRYSVRIKMVVIAARENADH